MRVTECCGRCHGSRVSHPASSRTPRTRRGETQTSPPVSSGPASSGTGHAPSHGGRSPGTGPLWSGGRGVSSGGGRGSSRLPWKREAGGESCHHDNGCLTPTRPSDTPRGVTATDTSNHAFLPRVRGQGSGCVHLVCEGCFGVRCVCGAGPGADPGGSPGGCPGGGPGGRPGGGPGGGPGGTGVLEGA